VLRTLLVSGAALLPGARALARLTAAGADDPDPVPLVRTLMAEAAHGTDVAALVEAAGRLFLGAPYRAGTLEGDGPERLRTTLDAFDCVTFVETSLALARCAARGDAAAGAFERELTFLRYRNGRMDGYGSRLHYMLEWIWENSRRGAVEDVTAALGGKERRKRISFMTDNARRYPALADAAARAAVAAAERRLSSVTFREIPARRIARAADGIRAGDIIGITTTVRGLDVSHTGLAVRDGGVLRLLHAGTSGGGVAVSSGSLAAFVAGHRHAAGIIVARPRPPAG
jgi:cell wall-associated NlpC family hydrolase